MLVQLVLLLICHTILADPLPKPFYDVDNNEVVRQHFEKFIETYQKKYSQSEKSMRFNTFVENLKEINRLNDEHQLTTFAIGKFTDLTKEERRSLLGFGGSDIDPLGQCKPQYDPETKDAPAAWDWRDKKVVSPVKTQGKCGSCWAFSATALVESRCMQKGKQVILSEQQMVDCDPQSSGCKGGLMSLGLTEIMKQGGQESQSDYPYEDNDNNTCRFDKNKIAAKVTDCSDYYLSGEEALKELLFKEGPLSIGLSSFAWFDYYSGIFELCLFYFSLNHGLLLVGYGSEGGEDFWVVKNSWGADWGEDGYIRLKRGVHCCGIGFNLTDSVVSANVA